MPAWQQAFFSDNNRIQADATLQSCPLPKSRGSSGGMTLSDEIREVEKGKVDGDVVYFPAGR
jgi:hypothetical protein